MFQTFCPLHGRNGLRSVAAAGIDALARKEFKPLDQRQHQQPLHMAWLARGKGHHWWLHWSYELTSVDYRIYIRVQKIDGKMESYWNALLKVISAVLFLRLIYTTRDKSFCHLLEPVQKLKPGPPLGCVILFATQLRTVKLLKPRWISFVLIKIWLIFWLDVHPAESWYHRFDLSQSQKLQVKVRSPLTGSQFRCHAWE